MIYSSGDDYLRSPHKRVLLFGMSGLGKTHLSNMLRSEGNWFHYSVDYRIGTRYMGEFITDNFKREAMKVPLLRDLLMKDSVYISANLTFDNLSPLSSYLGKPGAEKLGGLNFDEYIRRQQQHRQAETASMFDCASFIERAQDIYGYQNFVCDASGSLCEVVDPWDRSDPLISELCQHMLLVWIKGSKAHTKELIRRFDKAPKPMYFQPDFLRNAWDEYQRHSAPEPKEQDPDAFIRWAYERVLAHRQPRYDAMSQWGVTIDADDVKNTTNPEAFNQLIARAIHSPQSHPKKYS